jgi:hypothetical protein
MLLKRPVCEPGISGRNNYFYTMQYTEGTTNRSEIALPFRLCVLNVLSDIYVPHSHIDVYHDEADNDVPNSNICIIDGVICTEESKLH